MAQPISVGTAKSEIVVLPNDANHYGTLFGGTLLSLMDRTAFIAARKYAQNDVVTVSIREVVFKAPIKVGDIAEISAFVSFVGQTSVEVCINVVSNKREVIENAYFTFVNVDAEGKPIPVLQPSFETQNERERYEMRQAERESEIACLNAIHQNKAADVRSVQ